MELNYKNYTINIWFSFASLDVKDRIMTTL